MNLIEGKGVAKNEFRSVSSSGYPNPINAKISQRTSTNVLSYRAPATIQIKLRSCIAFHCKC